MNWISVNSRPKRRTIIGLACLLAFGLGGNHEAAATVEKETGFLAVTEENDSLSRPLGQHQDRHYTQGLKIVLFGGDDFLPGVTNKLNQMFPAIGIQPEAAHLGWILLGQNIYTPSNILQRPPSTKDRPYAGWLYTGFVYQRREEVSPTLAIMENFEINFGVVGPYSLAAESQKTIHHWWVPDDVPKGWNSQLHNEPGLELKYYRLYRWAPVAPLANYVDVIGRAGGEVGNVFDLATAGGTVRLGYNLPKDFGAAYIESPGSVNGGQRPTTPWFYAYGFVGADGRLVGHDITLDGNTGRGGPHVTKNVFVGDFSWGFAVQMFRHVEIAYTRIIRTEQFRGQDGDDVLGSLTVKGTFCF